MTAVTSHQHLPELIDEMPQGEAEDMVNDYVDILSGMHFFK